nr:NADH dehydrogenase subunit 4L [Praticolella mexicana]APD28042.1 NADH dehydrogenase subunit 4L [Praticolella mexicana]
MTCHWTAYSVLFFLMLLMWYNKSTLLASLICLEMMMFALLVMFLYLFSHSWALSLNIYIMLLSFVVGGAVLALGLLVCLLR